MASPVQSQPSKGDKVRHAFSELCSILLFIKFTQFPQSTFVQMSPDNSDIKSALGASV